MLSKELTNIRYSRYLPEGPDFWCWLKKIELVFIKIPMIAYSV